MTSNAGTATERGLPSNASGLLLGLGLGGFLDGIILHQVLQWHHLVSDVDAYPTNTVAGLEVNTLADGWRRAGRSTSACSSWAGECSTSWRAW